MNVHSEGLPRAARIDWVDAAKGVSILLIAMHHAELMTRELHLGEPIYVLAKSLFAPIRMPLFFFLVGLFATKAISGTWRDLLRNKVAFYAYLFALWSLVRFVIFAAGVENPVNPHEGSSARELMTMWIKPETGLWFLWCLAIYFPLTKLLSALPRPLAIGLLVAAAALFSLKFLKAPIFSIRNLVVYAPFFAIGAWYRGPLLDRFTRRPVSTLCLSAAVLAVLLGATGGGGRVALLATMLIPYCVVPLACATLILVHARLGGMPWLEYLGRNTLPIYVMHVVVIVLAAHSVSLIGEGRLVKVAAMPLVLAIGVGLPLLWHEALGAFGRRWLFSTQGLSEASAHAKGYLRRHRAGSVPLA